LGWEDIGVSEAYKIKKAQVIEIVHAYDRISFFPFNLLNNLYTHRNKPDISRRIPHISRDHGANCRHHGDRPEREAITTRKNLYAP
jgi:hypothetical protein